MRGPGLGLGEIATSKSNRLFLCIASLHGLSFKTVHSRFVLLLVLFQSLMLSDANPKIKEIAGRVIGASVDGS